MKRLAEMTVVLTGSFPVSRDYLKRRLMKAGARVSGFVNKNTDLLVTGARPGSKLDAARCLGVAVTDMPNLLEMLAVAENYDRQRRGMWPPTWTQGDLDRLKAAIDQVTYTEQELAQL